MTSYGDPNHSYICRTSIFCINKVNEILQGGNGNSEKYASSFLYYGIFQSPVCGFPTSLTRIVLGIYTTIPYS